MMKKTLLLCSGILLAILAAAQEEKEKSFLKNVQIAQSLETADKKEEPAQLQITIPKDDSSSWLVNLGIGIKLKTKSINKIARLNAEYHKNTLTDEKQNNLSAGYSLQWLLGSKKNTDFFLTTDVKYVYDGIETTNSLAGNLLFTFANDGPFNTFRRSKDKTTGVFLSLYGGMQAQYAFKAANDSREGFVFRPVGKAAFYFDLYNKNDPNTPSPKFRFTIDYTLRTDAVNTTKVEEGFTSLLTAGAEWFLVYKPVRISLGASFNYGADPLKGLEKQQYWLLSLNLFKK